MPARKPPKAKGVLNPGLSHGVAVITGTTPWGRDDVESGRQCLRIHPGGMGGPIPVVCCCCGKGNQEADRIAATIDYGPRMEDQSKPPKEAPKHKPRTRAKYRLAKAS